MVTCRNYCFLRKKILIESAYSVLFLSYIDHINDIFNLQTSSGMDELNEAGQKPFYH